MVTVHSAQPTGKPVQRVSMMVWDLSGNNTEVWQWRCVTLMGRNDVWLKCRKHRSSNLFGNWFAHWTLRHPYRLNTEVYITKVCLLLQLYKYLFSCCHHPWHILYCCCISFIYCSSCFRTTNANKPNNYRLSYGMIHYQIHSSHIFHRHNDSLFECLTYTIVILPYLCYFVILNFYNPIVFGIISFAHLKKIVACIF